MSTPLKIISFPDNTQFNSNKITIDTDIYDQLDTNKIYNHKGTYIITSSSYYDNNTMPYNAFNGSNDAYWKSNTSGNDYRFSPPIVPYTQPPYASNNKSESSSSIYQGGGNVGFNYYNTQVIFSGGSNTPSKISGEWLQIKLPSSMIVSKYSILTPIAQKSLHYFPLEFSLVGSQDGNKWYYINQQMLTSAPDVSKREPVSFNLQNSISYPYYRIIFTKMPHGCDNVRINQFNLFGIPKKEGFIGSINPQFSYYNILQPSLNNFSNFAISNPTRLIENFELQNNIGGNVEENININTESILLCGILVTLLLSVIYYRNK